MICFLCIKWPKKLKSAKRSPPLFLIPLSLSPTGSWGWGNRPSCSCDHSPWIQGPHTWVGSFRGVELAPPSAAAECPCLRRVPTHSHSGDSTGLSLRVERKQTPSSWRVIQSKRLVTGLCCLRISETSRRIRPKTLAERPEELNVW